MHKEANVGIDVFLPELEWHQEEMVVIHPDQIGILLVLKDTRGERGINVKEAVPKVKILFFIHCFFRSSEIMK